MIITRALRAASVFVLAALAAVVGVGTHLDAARRIEARDTTWAVHGAAADHDGEGQARPSDTTW